MSINSMTVNSMTINQEACEWIAKMHDADLSVEQAEQLRQWMAQSLAHKQELKRMAQRWDELNVLTELAVPLVPDAMAADNSQRCGFSVGCWLGINAAAR